MSHMDDLRQPDQYKGVIFIGRVVVNNDPDKLERVKVRIPQIFDDTEDSDLPWCLPMIGRLQGNSQTIQWFSVPDIGTLLYIEFQRGDPQYPMYIGSPVTKGTLSALANTNYPNRWGFTDRHGNHFYSDTQSGDVEFRHASGTTIHIYPNGDMTTTVVGNLLTNVAGTTTINSAGNMTLHSDVHIGLDAPRIDWN